MKKTRAEKGITLVALIITIVVLIILAVVAINSITNTGVVNYTNNSVNQYLTRQEEENGTLSSYTNLLGNQSGNGTGTTGGTSVSTNGTWTTSGTSVTNGTSTIKIGNIVTGYDASKDKNGNSTGVTDPGWRLLGVSGGKIQLVSANSVSVESYSSYAKGKGATSGTYYSSGVLSNIVLENEKGLYVRCEDWDRIFATSDYYDPITGETHHGRYEEFGYGCWQWDGSGWTYTTIQDGNPNIVEMVVVTLDGSITLTDTGRQ